MKCSFEFENHPPCIVLNTKKYNYLDDLLKDQSGREEFKMISFQIECIEFNGSHINIRSENCINCFYCVFGCPGNSIEVNDFYVFKADHQHAVMPFKTKVKGDIRRSMSFNFITND